MSKNLFITGTHTDVGKTYVTALICKKLTQNGLNAGYFKAAASGNPKDEKTGEIIPADAKFVKDFAGLKSKLEEMVAYSYLDAYSPHLAAKFSSNSPQMSVIKSKFQAVCAKFDYVSVEGSGGIICPIRYDDTKIMLTDMIKELNLAVLLIADAGLGTINSSFLTIRYLKEQGISLKGIILNNFEAGKILHEDNRFMIEELTGAKVVATIASGDQGLNLSLEELLNLYE